MPDHLLEGHFDNPSRAVFQTVLKRYGTDPDEYTDDFKRMDKDPNSDLYDQLHLEESRISLAKTDPDVAFVVDSFFGDLSQGLEKVMLQVLALRQISCVPRTRID